MSFLPPPFGKSQALRDLSPEAKAEFKRLRLLVDHARKTPWLSDLEMEKDRCQVIQAVMEEFGAKHTRMLMKESRVLLGGPQDRSVNCKAFGFEVSSGRTAVFLGPRGERDKELSNERSVNKENPGCAYYPGSSWMDFKEEQLIIEDPRSYPLGNRLVDEGLSVLQASSLAVSTPQSSTRKPRNRL